MNDLNLLLREATADAPPDRFDATAVLRTGRSRVRRRRLAALAGTAAAVAAVAAIPFTLGGDGTRGTQPIARADVRLTLADAVPAREGVDFEVLHRLQADSSDGGMRGQFVRGVLPDGRVVVQEYAPGLPERGRILLLGQQARTSDPAPKDLSNYVGATARAAFFGADADGLWTLRLDDLSWHHGGPGTPLDTNPQVQAQYPRTGSLVLASSLTMDGTSRPLHEVEVRRPGVITGPVPPLATGGEVAVTGDLVAWTARHDHYNKRVTILDRTTGERTGFDPRTGRCVQKAIAVTLDRVTLMLNCADRPDDDHMTDVIDQIVVFDHQGHALAEISGDQWGPVRATERFLTLTSRKPGEAGTYVYDLADGRLRKVAQASFPDFWTEAGSQDRLVWADGKGDEYEYVVAQMH